jgi:hypothetical protein
VARSEVGGNEPRRRDLLLRQSTRLTLEAIDPTQVVGLRTSEFVPRAGVVRAPPTQLDVAASSGMRD